MRFVFAALSVLSLLVAFTVSNPVVLGFALLGIFLFSFLAVLAFAQAKIDAGRQRETYLPSGAELEALRRAAEKRKQAAAPADAEVE
jgi:hypothetical protein